jgi:glycosyltransferase involved in cell wall biosynthesis
MQIAIVTSEYGETSGGLSYSCTVFSNLLKELGHNVLVISSIENNTISSEDFEIVQSTVEIVDGGYKPKLKKHLFFRAHVQNVLAQIQNKRIDYIIAFGAGLNGLFAVELSQQTNIRLITMLRGSEMNLSVSDFELRAANYACLKKSSKVIALSNELLERSKNIFYSSNVVYEVIPNIVAVPHEISIYHKNKRQILFGCGSYNLNEKKGIANLIVMMAHLKKISTKQFKMEFVGKADEDLMLNYKELTDKLNVIDRIEFIGKLSRNEFIKRMNDWDCYVQGSFCEGFSNSVSDYLSLGKPFVLSNTGYIAESIREQCPEIVFDDFNPQNMANKIVEISNNQNIDSIYQKAFRLIGSSTNIEKVISLWENIFNQTTPNKKQSDKLDKHILSVVLHDLSQNYTNIDTPINVFREFVEQVAKNGYSLCSAKHYFENTNRKNLIICTFDDAYSGVKKYALPILKEYGFTATVFVCFDYIGNNNNWNLKDKVIRKHLNINELKELLSEGWEIGSHGLTHNSLLRLSEKELEKELSESKNNLSTELGLIDSYAYPYGDYNDYCKHKVSENYHYAFALTKGGTIDGLDNYQIRRYFISELNCLLK